MSWEGLRTHWAAWFLLALLLWLFAHPYWGIYHDVRLYALLAAQWLDPSAYVRELFFIYGSQGSYTLFTPFFAALVKWMGLDLAAQSVTLLGAGLWITALLLLSRHILGKSGLGLFALLFFSAATISYSPNGDTFVLNEGFATPRCIVMPLGLLAVYLAQSGRLRQAIALAVFSMTLHPLIGVWALLICFSFVFTASRLVMLSSLALAFVFAWSYWVLPPAHLLAGDWLSAIASPSNDVLVGGWGTARLNAILSWLFMLLLGARLGSPAVQPLYRNVALMGATAFFAATIVSLFPTQPLVQLQLWRALWLVVPIAGLGVLDAFRCSLQRSPRNVVLWAYLLIACLTSPELSSTWLAIAWGGLVINGEGGSLSESIESLRAQSRLLEYGVLLGTVLALPHVYFDLHALANSVSLDWFPILPLWVQGLVIGGGWLLPAALSVCFSWRMGTALILAAAVTLLPYAMVHRDQRTNRNQLGEACLLNSHCAPHVFSTFVRPGEVVFDGRNDLYIWFRLHASNYLSSTQAVGIVFSEEKFREWLRRRDALASAPVVDRTRLVISDQESQRQIRPWKACADSRVAWVVSNTGAERREIEALGGVPAAMLEGKTLFSCAFLRAKN